MEIFPNVHKGIFAGNSCACNAFFCSGIVFAVEPLDKVPHQLSLRIFCSLGSIAFKAKTIQLTYQLLDFDNFLELLR